MSIQPSVPGPTGVSESVGSVRREGKGDRECFMRAKVPMKEVKHAKTVLRIFYMTNEFVFCLDTSVVFGQTMNINLAPGKREGVRNGDMLWPRCGA